MAHQFGSNPRPTEAIVLCDERLFIMGNTEAEAHFWVENQRGELEALPVARALDTRYRFRLTWRRGQFSAPPV